MNSKMYDPIFSKSFSRVDRRRFGFCALILCFVLAFTISSSSKNASHTFTTIRDAIDLLVLRINFVEETSSSIMAGDNTVDYDAKFEILNEVHGSIVLPNQTITISPSPPTADNNSNIKLAMKVQHPKSDTTLVYEPKANVDKNVTLSNGSKADMQMVHETAPISQPTRFEMKKEEPICRVLDSNADYCEMEGDIRVQPYSSTIFLVNPSPSFSRSWTIQPYPRKGIDYVKHWTVKSISANDAADVPTCTFRHATPAMLFSLGGFSGNYFHDFADLITPLYSTSYRFKRNVTFLASDYKDFWVVKFRTLLSKMSKEPVVDIDKENQVIHCYSAMIAGLQFHKELIFDPASTPPDAPPSMHGFRQLLRQTYSLERSSTAATQVLMKAKPRLMIITRNRTRILTNHDEVSNLARRLGYEVVLAEAETSTDMSSFAQLVNTCDVLMGVHGAGLTNMVFLPDGAVLVQVVPLGGIEVFAKLDFGDPARGMKIKYVEYSVGVNESSLIEVYGRDHPVLVDPFSYHRKGWNVLRDIYLENQNVTIDLQRFEATLVKAMKLLRH